MYQGICRRNSSFIYWISSSVPNDICDITLYKLKLNSMKKSRINMLNKVIVWMWILWSAFLCFWYTQNTILTDQTWYSFTMPDHDLELMATSEANPSVWWGWWGWVSRDKCPWWDYSSSFYDWDCGTAPSMDTWSDEEEHGSAERECSIVWSEFTDELNGAYQYACSVWITTMEPIQNADMVWPLLRKHLAKMVSEFAVNELWMAPDKEKVCEFDDMAWETKEMKKYAEMACQLWFMGLHSDWVQVKDNFDPNDQVIRAEFGTVLSRLLWWTKYATDDGELFYKYHLEALKENGIMTQIYGDWPYSIELRWYVMLMLMRVAWLKWTETWSDIVQSEIWNVDTWDNVLTWWDAKVDEWNMHVSFVWFKNGVMTTTWDYIHVIWALDPSQKVVSVRVTHRDTKWKSKITKYKLSKYEAATHYFWFNASVVNKSLTLKDKNTYEFEFYDADDKLLFKKSVMIIQK